MFVQPGVEEERLSICHKCPHLSQRNFCGICSCYMPAKAKLKITSCPLGKWSKDKDCYRPPWERDR